MPNFAIMTAKCNRQKGAGFYAPIKWYRGEPVSSLGMSLYGKAFYPVINGRRRLR